MRVQVIVLPSNAYCTLNICYTLINFPILQLQEKAQKVQHTRAVTQLMNGGTQMQTWGDLTLECELLPTVLY